MTTIVIKDLNESKELDRQAMRNVAGGSAIPHSGRKFSTSRMSTLFQSSALKLTTQGADNGIT